ncbi:MAG: Rossmann-like and DUF2520 domain-containing protein [Ilumatobacter sp.]
MSRSCVVIGSGRAGGSFHAALGEVGWAIEMVAARSLLDGVDDVLADVDIGSADLVLLTVPDGAIAAVAQAVPATGAVVAHVSGVCDLGVLAPHERVGSIHPLMSLPDATTGSRRLLDSCTFAVDGDALVAEVADALGGRAIHVPASSRALYHATAAVAANHLVALCAQVESLAGEVGVPIDAYWTMMRTTLDNVAESGAGSSLTGPAARGDWDTVRAHVAALPTDDDRTLYLALCEAAARLAGRKLPDLD